MSAPPPDTEPAAPAMPEATQNPAVDQALSGLVDLDRQPLAGHHDRIAAAHEQVRTALDPVRDPAGD